MTTKETKTGTFFEALASSAPAPGGGGASALCGALGAALASMVANLTYGKKKYAQFDKDMQRILEKAQDLQDKLIACVDADARCFEPLSRAYSIPKDDPQRSRIMEEALELACSAPLEMMELSAEALELHGELLEKGSRLMISDVGVGTLCCRTAMAGASLNVITNAKLMADRNRAEELYNRVQDLLNKYVPMADEIYSKVLKEMEL